MKRKSKRFAVIVTDGGVERRIEADSFEDIGIWFMDNHRSHWEDEVPNDEDDGWHVVNVDKPPLTPTDKATEDDDIHFGDNAYLQQANVAQ